MKTPRVPLRFRLALAYGGVLAVILASLGVVFYARTRSFLLESTGRRVRAQAKPVIERWMPELQRDGAGAGLGAIAAPLARDLTSRDTVATIIARSGRILATGRLLPEEPQAPPVARSELEQALQGENEVTVLESVQGRRFLVVYVPLRPAPGHASIVGAAQLATRLDLVDGVLSRLWAGLVAALLLALAAGGGLGLLLTGSALRVLGPLVATCRAIADGDLRRRTGLARRNDELGDLARAFDEMAERIESMFAVQNRFVANAAHELRSPLTVLRGSLEILLRGDADDAAAARELHRGMHAEVQRLSRTCDALLELSRVEGASALEREPLAVAGLVRGSVARARRTAGDRILVISEGPPVTLRGSGSLLAELLDNLLENAVEHTGPHGRIEVSWSARNGSVELTVEDDGEGIEPAELPRIFEPFFQGSRRRNRRHRGTGLGLALVRAIAEAHGGGVTASNRQGGGARVRATLPVS
ncbi:MAG: HAMP domain-containing histidine kinase [Acidobacteria bacterium]|nr:HAMP domain-containing histidine kinase [Acidobacteriota bacterium]